MSGMTVNISGTMHALVWTFGPLLYLVQRLQCLSHSGYIVLFSHVSRQIILHNLCLKEVRTILTIIHHCPNKNIMH